MPELISQAIAIGLSIAVVVSLVGILNVVREGNQQNVAQAMAENVCAKLKLGVESIYSTASSKIVLTLPAKIGGEAYVISSDGRLFNITSSSASTRCATSVPAQISGSSPGGNVVLDLSGNNIMISGA